MKNYIKEYKLGRFANTSWLWSVNNGNLYQY